MHPNSTRVEVNNARLQGYNDPSPAAALTITVRLETLDGRAGALWSLHEAGATA
jgi:hypothetical protein